MNQSGSWNSHPDLSVGTTAATGVPSRRLAIYSGTSAKSRARRRSLLAHVVGQSLHGLQHATVTCSTRNASRGLAKDLQRIRFDDLNVGVGASMHAFGAFWQRKA